MVENLKVSTKVKAERIARFAFDYALRNGRKKVTCVHKANIMKVSIPPFLVTLFIMHGSSSYPWVSLDEHSSVMVYS